MTQAYENIIRQKLSNHSEKYYRETKSDSKDILTNPGLQYFFDVAKECDSILDCGCGEGTKLSAIGAKSKHCHGIDANSKAIAMAQSAHPSLHVKTGDIYHLDYDTDSFDFVYSAFTFEHLTEPAMALEEMIRVAKPNALVGIICPNFGSACYRSPCSDLPPIRRSLKILFKDLFIVFRSRKKLLWERVDPVTTEEQWEADWDTTVEPSLISLLHFLGTQPNIEIVEKSSLWILANTPLPTGSSLIAKIAQSARACLARIGQMGLFPFVYWGPQLFLVIRKTSNKDTSEDL